MQSYEAILAQFPGPVLLRPSRRKWGIMLVVCSLFILGGAFALHEPTTSSSDVLWAWFGVVFFGCGILLSAAILLDPNLGLTLDHDGFTMRLISRRSIRSTWQQVSDFAVARMGPAGNRMVVYDDERVIGAAAKLNRSLAGRTSALPDTYGLRAEDLAKLLNAWRDRAIRGR